MMTTGREKRGIRLGIIGVLLNTVLVVLKLVVGMIINSISLIGDALNNLGDTLSSFINIVSFKISKKPADKEHPYGHKRSEYVGSLLISVLIIIVAVELVINSINKIINPEKTLISWYIFLVLIVNIIIKLTMAFLYRKGFKETKSLTLKASFKDSISDLGVTLTLIMGLVISNLFNFEVDGYLGCLVALIIFYQGYRLIKESSDKIIGEPIDETMIDLIKLNISQCNEIIGIHDVLYHQYGEGRIFVSLHVEMNGNLSLIEAHSIIDEIEMQIKKQFGIELLIHIDPIDFSNKELAKVKTIIRNIIREIDQNLSFHDLRITPDKRAYFDLEMPYTYQDRSKDIVNLITSEISKSIKYNSSIEINYK